MDAREQRGLQLAATRHIRQKNGVWIVPSQSDPDAKYTVDPTAGSCSCPDHEGRRAKCKHLFAVEYAIKRETDANGRTTVTEVVKVTRKTYTQDWTAYNAAQTTEKTRVTDLLHRLCAGVQQPLQTRGRPRLQLSDAIFAATMKVYLTTSGRRAVSDLRECQAKGYLDKAPHYNSVSHYMDDTTLTVVLKALIEESADPLRAVERDFAVDSTGFSTSTFDRWYEQKYGAVSQKAYRKFVKCHAMVGVRTHVVTAVEVTEGDAHDSPYLPQLVDATVSRFKPVEISADKGYLSRENLEKIASVGAAPFVPFKSNSTEGPKDDLWRKLFHFFQFKRDDFLAHYHKRSNVETVFHMIKSKFGASVRSKTDTAQKNEVLLKVLCHNLCVLVQAICELGLEPTFWAEAATPTPHGT